MLLWAHSSPGKSSHWPLAYCIAPETKQQLNVLVRLWFIGLFLFKEMTGRTSLTFAIPFVFLLPLVLVTLTSLTLLSSSISSEHFHVPGLIQSENRAKTVWVKFALRMHVLVLKWDCSGDFQRVLLALNQTTLVGAIPAPALDGAVQEGNPLNAAAGQSSTPRYFQ